MLIEGGFLTYSGDDGMYDVGSDGRFLMIQPTSPFDNSTAALRDELTVVLNWTSELERLAQPGN